MPFDPAKITVRRQEIGAEFARLDDQWARLVTEDEELEIAQRVVQRLDSGSSPIHEESEKGMKGRWAPRPKGTPSIFNMTNIVLSDAESEGRHTLSPTELVEEIRHRFWPGLSGKQILPSVYHFARIGRLQRTPDGNIARIPSGEAVDLLLKNEGPPPSESREAQPF
jgi:hypothetical protein